MNECDALIARMLAVGFEGTTITSELRELLMRGVSTVILFTRNYESPTQLAELCRSIKNDPAAEARPIMICVDHEGGRVQRFREPFTIIPSMRELGRRNDVAEVRRIGAMIAKELRAVNIDMNLAPVLDVDSNPANPVIGERSFGSDPTQVAQRGCALIDGLQCREPASGDGGIAACGKHFPGHGDTVVDSHFDLPRLSHEMDRLQRVELPPFAAAIRAGVAAIMIAHVMFDAIDSTRPATMSAPVVDELLRKKMGFDRIVCSDDLEMKAILDHFGIEEAVVCGVQAGIDLFFVCRDHELQHRAIDALAHAVQSGAVPSGRIAQSNRRLDQLFDRFVRSAGRSAAAAHHSPA